MATTTDTRLLVPINVEALCVGTMDVNWVDLRPDFTGIKGSRFLGQKIAKQNIFQRLTTGLLEPGVHLHWALPDGLTHGRKAENERLKFPLAPNRWLVVRSWDEGKGKGRQLRHRAWMVESDTVTPSEDSGEAQSSWPRLLSGSSPKADYVFVGKWVDLDAPSVSSKERIPLTAVGYGDPAYAAYYPACRWSLGFHDDLVKKEGTNPVELQDVTLNYFVAGWYSSNDYDPLHQAITSTSEQDIFKTLNTFLGEHGWTYPGFEEQLADSAHDVEAIKKKVPSGLICHGTVSGVLWKNKDRSYRTSVDGEVKVAAGDTAVEALAALWSDQPGINGELVKLLEAFQYDLVGDLEAAGGEYAFEQKLHERGYRPVTRGIRWDLIARERDGTEEAGDKKTPPIPGAVRDFLERVNTKQKEINLLKRQRDAARSQLYSAWYKRVLNRSAKKEDEKSLTAQEGALREEIRGLTDRIEALEEVREGRPAGEEWQQLHESIAQFAPEFTVQAVEEARFWRPTDPVLLLTGPACRRSSRHGEDGRYRKDGRLLCRLTGQTIAELQVSIGGNSNNFGPGDLKKWCDPFSLPRQEVHDLFLESLLLTPNSDRAKAIASAIYEKIGPQGAGKAVETLAENIRNGLENFWNEACDPAKADEDMHYQSGETILKLTQNFPSAVTLNIWKVNPWIPLFLQWQASWRPGYAATTHALDNWELNASGTIFKMTANTSTNKDFLYEGTVLLTPGAIWTFGDRLGEYARVHHVPKLKTLQTRVHSMDVLCQSLAGFSESLLMRKAYLELRPLEPDVYEDVKDIDWISPLTDGDFFPVRAGDLQLKKLRLVDAFGQYKEVTFSKVHLPPELKDPNGPVGSIRLEPRIAQPARLTMNWPSSVPADPHASPVCGWILPNLLDAGLMIYDAQGHALGALQAVKRKSWESGVGGFQKEIEGFHWVGLPGNSSVSFRELSKRKNDLSDARVIHDLQAFVNPDLRAFVEGLLSIGSASGEAFGDLLESISHVASGGGNGEISGRDANLALLIGKPLALVRASISLELDGGPARSQGWNESQKTWEDQTRGIAGLEIAVRLGDRRKWGDLWLGDDGLVGFFQKQNFKQFFPAFGLERANDRTSDSYSIYKATPTVSLNKPLEMTLLMDPARGVAVTTGILPRQIFHLPHRDLAETLEHKQVIFYTGPVVGPKADETTPKIHMPKPSDLYGQWSWTHHPAVEVWQEAAIADTQKEAGHFSDAGLSITEGWLKLVTAPLAIRTFTVKGKDSVVPAGTSNGKQQPDEFVVRRGETITLSWTVSGADRIELYRGKSLVFESRRLPLPAQRVVEVNQDTSFVLKAIARADPLAASLETAGNELTRTIQLKIR
jgi:hypothetical protein